jgi:cysteine desulfurase/selenocysteine lyase
MNIKRPDAIDGLDLSGASEAMAAGLPDPETLTRLAAQFYQEFLQAAPAVPATPSISSIPTTVDESSFSSLSLPMSESELQTAANQAGTYASGVGAQPSSFPTPTVPSAGSWIPGGVSAGDFSTVPSFSFLESARTLVEQTPGVGAYAPQAAAQPIKIPTETELRGLSPSLPGHIPTQIPAAPVQAIATPQIPGQIPGAGMRTGDQGLTPAFQFLEATRSIWSLNPTTSADQSLPSGYEATVPAASSIGFFDVNAVRRDFPILSERVNGRPLIWLDNAATTQKPQAVIDRLSYFYEHENSNVHRAAHELAARSTDAYDGAREKVRRFLNAGSTREIVFVRGATEAINLVAKSWGRQHVHEGDEIVVTHLEHHANIVPWQMLCAEKGAKLRVAPVDNDGQVLLDEYEKLLGPKTRLVAFAQVSNALGTVTPVEEMTAIAHRYGAKVLIDGAQAVSHMQVDVQAYDCDFYVFSGHKIFAPTGIGVVYGKQEVLDRTPPWQGGGNMIVDVTFEKTVYHPAPFRFEAGTGSIADAVGLGAALDYLDRIGMANIARYEHELLEYGMRELKRIPGLHLIGTAREKASVLSFVLDGFTTEEVGQALNREGIAVRSGHHCAQPILRRFGLESTVRPSLAFYNTCEEIDALIAAIWNLKQGKTPGPL